MLERFLVTISRGASAPGGRTGRWRGVVNPAACPLWTGKVVLMTLNPPGQYADDRNLRARQRLWQHQRPVFDIAGWVLGLAGLAPGQRVLDAGCGNGAYLRALRGRPVRVAGCDLSPGMLSAAGHPVLVNADVAALPFRDGAFDVVLTAHMLYHVPDRAAAVRELRRVLAAGGTCVAVTNGARLLRSLRELVEAAVGQAAPGWRMRSPSERAFAAENAALQLRAAFGSVTCVRPAGVPPVVIRDAALAADYVASAGDQYQDQVPAPGRTWSQTCAGRCKP
jgi:SAM-dependent methyltransferase